ncbi:hypothetical protein BJ166DRAFT_157933 [Pestalotiopsis sp. NC0098]|nr:hypothetical protein BJ166DRAFT_157933 [Pestalotiopsis sp. NC0098]
MAPSMPSSLPRKQRSGFEPLRRYSCREALSGHRFHVASRLPSLLMVSYGLCIEKKSYYGAAISFPGAQRRSYRFRLSIVSGGLNSTTASPQLHELSVLSSSARSNRTASAATLPDAQRRHLLISLLPCCADRIASGSICNNSSASNHSRIYPNKKSHVPAVGHMPASKLSCLERQPFN